MLSECSSVAFIFFHLSSLFTRSFNQIIIYIFVKQQSNNKSHIINHSLGRLRQPFWVLPHQCLTHSHWSWHSCAIRLCWQGITNHISMFLQFEQVIVRWQTQQRCPGLQGHIIIAIFSFMQLYLLRLGKIFWMSMMVWAMTLCLTSADRGNTNSAIHYFQISCIIRFHIIAGSIHDTNLLFLANKCSVNMYIRLAWSPLHSGISFSKVQHLQVDQEPAIRVVQLVHDLLELAIMGSFLHHFL